MKTSKVLSVTGLFILFLCLFSCSKEEVIPAISIPEGAKDYFASSVDFDNHANEKTIVFTSNVPWTAIVDETIGEVTWCNVSPGYGDAGTGSFKISVKENETYDDRNAVVRFAYGDSVRTIFVNQKQLDALTLTSDRFELPVEGGDFDVEVKANIEYSVKIAEDCQDWIHKKSSTTRALSSSTLTFSVDRSQEYDKREGTIEIISGEKKETITVYQTGEGILTLTKKVFDLNNSEQDVQIEVKSNFSYSVDLPEVDWITEDRAQTRSVSTHSINLHIAENATYDDRSAVIRIYDKNSDLSEEVTINQSRTKVLSVDQKEFAFDELGGTFSVKVSSSVPYNVAIGDSWVSEAATATTRSLEESLRHFTVAKMTDNNDRETKITFSDSSSGLKEVVTVKQSRSLYIQTSTMQMMLEDTKQIPLINKLDQELNWQSSNPEIVTIDNSGMATAKSRGTATVTVSSSDGKYTSSCEITVKEISDYISMQRTGSSYVVSPYGTRYSVTFTIYNNSPETIHIVSLAGVTEGVSQDLAGRTSVSITLTGTTAYIQNYMQTLIYTYKGRQYSLQG